MIMCFFFSKKLNFKVIIAHALLSNSLFKGTARPCQAESIKLLDSYNRYCLIYKGKKEILENMVVVGGVVSPPQKEHLFMSSFLFGAILPRARMDYRDLPFKASCK